MKTAMQELIEKLQQEKEMWKASGNATERRARGAYVHAIIMAKELLQKEKEQIIEAVQHGLWNNEVVEMANYSKIYYDSTFGDKETQAE